LLRLATGKCPPSPRRHHRGGSAQAVRSGRGSFSPGRARRHSLDMTAHQIQLRAAAVMLHEGLVLLHRRKGDAFWAMPGGHIETGEDARGALVREMQEELSETVDCGELLYV